MNRRELLELFSALATSWLIKEKKGSNTDLTKTEVRISGKYCRKPDVLKRAVELLASTTKKPEIIRKFNLEEISQYKCDYVIFGYMNAQTYILIGYNNYRIMLPQ